MKLVLFTAFTLAMLAVTISAAPTLVERSTLSDNTEVFSDAKAQKESVQDEDQDSNSYGDFDYSEYLLSD
ncbi:hypothetical protein HMPREF1544_05023 [Mucor circinelloides 1006PhL]|uniref:Uncharacterized protein n=1 Tax=Mucor circinelloides f. circinelloides (strain 1006PhL) TaxID=1220926 RepID=S2K7F3_MUCC1|nr:hypothetical protein HMPREF1544_05023 [Mucor circinelloides 1006PhL]